ncbi:MAG: YbhB/YbcL family Raf kinase inhibitor-like protein [Candidatus Kerfeldbacteria bacterium]|nr:YbhB/YbcL family Raf kinase inhibitor-like protein [Candidatus Kerfeldbacteria bacterium]
MNKIQRELLLILLVTVGVCISAATPISAKISLPAVKKVQVVNIDSEDVTVQWNKVTSAKKYQVWILNNNKTVLNQFSTTKTKKKVTGLQSSTSYYVKVRAKRGTQNGKWSQLKQFTTATADSEEKESMTISSPSFNDGGDIPVTFTCDGPGGGVSPELNWVSAPSDTQSFFLLMIDIDASDFVHWSVKNIPSTTTEALQNTDPEGGTNLPNAWGNTYYEGPCPPLEDGAHTYQFTLYALDVATLTSSTVSEALTELSTHVLEQYSITGEYDA